MDGDFAPVGSVLITVSVLVLGAMVLFFAVLARRGKPDRNFATADRQDLRSVIWTSEETWRASHRANAPWLFTASAGLFAGGAFMTGTIIVQGAAEAMPTMVAALCIALFWTIACCTAAGIDGRIAAKQVLARDR